MQKWEYKKIALNEPPRGSDDIDLLCDAGEEGWELVAVLSNGMAYLKREIKGTGASDREERELARGEQEVRAKYRDPVTGETWSGRGRMASWLKRKQDAREDIEKYLV